jgi:manganese/iron transport system ATP-binding protein
LTTFADPALLLDGVTVAYGRDPVVEDVDGVVMPGTALALIGPNGAGKSTLIKAILGLVPVVSGRIEVLGASPAESRGRVAYVPQAEALDAEFPVSVLDVVLMGQYREVGWVRRPGRAHRQLALDALAHVGLEHRAHDRFGVLSGGQRQRVLIARAVAQDARLLLLDEPFTGVDTTTTESLVSVLHDLRADGVAVVMSTHDLSVVHLTCGEACLLNRRQIAFGPIDEALTPALLRETYRGSALLLDGGHSVVVH